ncbi:hypothetical protein K1719_030679 [Acacia pycnantha]|nr:hypothetical protein K1719_030679 [Acacia pycnantha]
MEREASEQEGSPLRAEDNLRSTKKVRIRPEEGRSETESQHETSDIQMSEKVPAGGISYRNKLLNVGHVNEDNRKQAEVVISDTDFKVAQEGEVPCIEFSNAIRDLLAKGMERCLLVDMERSFYCATFDLEEDYMKVLTGGPWMIYGAYLTVQPWSLEFDAKTSSISKVVAWERIPGLIKVDVKFYGIEYEGLPHICFTCGKYGHSRDRCPTMTPIDRPEVSQGKEPSQGIRLLRSMVPSNAFSNQGTMGYKKQLNGASENIRRNPIGTKSGSAQQKLEYRPKTLVVGKASQMQDKAAKASQRQNEGMEAAGFSGVESVVSPNTVGVVVKYKEPGGSVEMVPNTLSSNIQPRRESDGGRDKENSPSGDLQRRPGANGVKLKSSGLRNLKVRKKAPGIQISKDALGVIREELDSLKDPSMPKKCMGDLAPSQEQVKN